jgi:hypothetical protein
MSDWCFRASYTELSNALHILFWCSWSTWRFLFRNTSISLNFFNQRFRTLSSGAFSPGRNLRYLHCTITIDFNSAYRKTNSTFCCTVHISPDTDSHWEVNLAGLRKSDSWPCTQVVSIDPGILFRWPCIYRYGIIDYKCAFKFWAEPVFQTEKYQHCSHIFTIYSSKYGQHRNRLVKIVHAILYIRQLVWKVKLSVCTTPWRCIREWRQSSRIVSPTRNRTSLACAISSLITVLSVRLLKDSVEGINIG